MFYHILKVVFKTLFLVFQIIVFCSRMASYNIDLSVWPLETDHLNGNENPQFSLPSDPFQSAESVLPLLETLTVRPWAIQLGTEDSPGPGHWSYLFSWIQACTLPCFSIVANKAVRKSSWPAVQEFFILWQSLATLGWNGSISETDFLSQRYIGVQCTQTYVRIQKQFSIYANDRMKQSVFREC